MLHIVKEKVPDGFSSSVTTFCILALLAIIFGLLAWEGIEAGGWRVILGLAGLVIAGLCALFSAAILWEILEHIRRAQREVRLATKPRDLRLIR